MTLNIYAFKCPKNKEPVNCYTCSKRQYNKCTHEATLNISRVGYDAALKELETKVKEGAVL
jgi:hypothetical protein